jgi:hypothetical protein
VKYTEKAAATGTCTTAALAGEIVAVHKYNLENGTSKMALKPLSLQEAESTAGIPSDQKVNVAIGDLPSNSPDANHVCTTPTMSTASLGGITYEFSNVQFYVTAAVPGSHFRGDVKRTEAGCTRTYEAIGMWEAVPCETDDDCAHGLNPALKSTCQAVGADKYCLASQAFPSVDETAGAH